MISAENAVRQVLECAAPLPQVAVPLSQASGRFLAESVHAKGGSPRFDNSAVDGFALSGNPPYRIVGSIAAGSTQMIRLNPSEAAEIFTGAPIPPGTDAIAMVEDCVVHNGMLDARLAGDHVRRAYEEFAPGALLAEAGAVLSPPLVGLLATGGISSVTVRGLPKVAIITTGDEVAEVDLGDSQIYNSNAPALKAAVLALGVEVRHSHLPDDPAAIKKGVAEVLDSADIVLTCGGISVGRHDHLREAFAAAGIKERFWRVAVKPGKPLWFGTSGPKLVFGLPGNSVSALVTYLIFARPAILKIMGGSSLVTENARLDHPLKKKPGRTEYVRGRLSVKNGELRVNSTQHQGSHMTMGLAHADVLIHFPSEQTQLPEDALVEIVPIRWGVLEGSL